MDIPENAKKPQDRKKPKKTKSERSTVEYQGEVYTALEDDALDNIEVVEALDNQQLTHALRLIFGPAEYERMKENLADENGRTKGSDIAKIWNKFLSENQAAKN